MLIRCTIIYHVHFLYCYQTKWFSVYTSVSPCSYYLFFVIKYKLAEMKISLIWWKLFCPLIEKVLAQLNLALVSKSDASYSDLALRALFRLNNHNYVVNALRRSSLMELLLLAEPSAEQTYYDLLLKDKNNYVTTAFTKARSYLADEPGTLISIRLNKIVSSHRNK